jgi:hypothetical protein
MVAPVLASYAYTNEPPVMNSIPSFTTGIARPPPPSSKRADCHAPLSVGSVSRLICVSVV